MAFSTEKKFKNKKNSPQKQSWVHSRFNQGLN